MTSLTDKPLNCAEKFDSDHCLDLKRQHRVLERFFLLVLHRVPHIREHPKMPQTPRSDSQLLQPAGFHVSVHKTGFSMYYCAGTDTEITSWKGRAYGFYSRVEKYRKTNE